MRSSPASADSTYPAQPEGMSGWKKEWASRSTPCEASHIGFGAVVVQQSNASLELTCQNDVGTLELRHLALQGRLSEAFLLQVGLELKTR